MTLRFLPVLLSSAFFSALPFVSSCSSLSCGAGTVEKGEQCVAAESDEEVMEIDFDGARAAAPASETSILVAWLPSETPDVVYHVYLATSEDGFNFSEPLAVAPAGASTVVLGGLDEETAYYVNVRASVGESEVPNEVVVTATTALDDEGPRFDGVVSAEAAPGAAVELTWEKATDDLTPAEALLYFVYAGPSAEEVDTNNPIGVSLPGATSIRVVLPVAEEKYFFLVQARDAAGNFDGNEEVVSSLSGEDREPPSFAGCKSAVGRTASSILVTWEPATDDIASQQEVVYNLYASETVNGFNFLAPDAQVTGASSGIIPGLERNTSYFVLCRAQDPSGNEDDNLRFQTARTKSDDVPPEFGGIVAVDNITASSVEVVWTTATDNQTPSESIVYDVFLAQEEDGFDFETDEPWMTTEPGATQIAIEDLEPNTAYYVVVLARDEGENRSEPEPPVGIKTLISFQVNVLGIFSAKGCAAASSCHAGASPSGFLSLSPALAYDELVGVVATTLPGYERVEPGNPADSHLVHRVKGEFPGEPPPDLARMPADGNFLSEAQISIIERWIAQGAENN